MSLLRFVTGSFLRSPQEGFFAKKAIIIDADFLNVITMHLFLDIMLTN